MLPKQAIEEFKELYFQDTGTKLSNEEATEQALALYNALDSLLVDRK